MYPFDLKYIKETLRAMPYLGLFFSLFISIIFKNKFSFILFCLLIIELNINMTSKELYHKYIGIDSTRPKNSTNCSVFNKIDKDNATGLVLGMPSGHSQNIFFLATFLALYFKSSLKLGLFLVAIYGAYLRVEINCHTIPQVVVGSIMGIIYGFVSYKLLYKFKLLN